VSAQIEPAYLITGTDEGKISAALARLRARAEQEGGAGALEVFAAVAGASTGPDPDTLLASIPALSLTASRRYLLADGVERWNAKRAAAVCEALAVLPPDVTIVFVAREQPPKLRVPKALADAVEEAGGKILTYEAPRARELPAWLVGEAARKGFELEPEAARLLVARMGESTVRLGTELDRLAVWAGEGGNVGLGDLEAMIADTSEEATWTLSDAIVDRDGATALAAAERLIAQGESVTGLIYGVAKRLREAHLALGALEGGRSARDVERELPMHPYAAKMLLRRVRGCSLEEIRAASCAIADLEWWTRGGSDYPEEVAVTLAVARAAGARVG